MKRDWTIKESESNWECTWEDSERFQLRYFKSLPFIEKCKAVENMCATANYFKQKANARRNKLSAATPEAGKLGGSLAPPKP